MTYLNRVAVLGEVARAPNTRATANNNVTTLSLKLTKRYEKGGEQKARTVYVDVKGWGRQSDALARLSEGDLVLIDGEIDTESWEKDGEKRWKTLVQASHVERLETAAPAPEPTKGERARKERHARIDEEFADDSGLPL